MLTLLFCVTDLVALEELSKVRVAVHGELLAEPQVQVQPRLRRPWALAGWDTVVYKGRTNPLIGSYQL